jgi:ring-1,2-phenylacetyl-CoA epoxidase subunit PaaE
MIKRLLGGDVSAIDRWYLCGPGDLVTTLHRDLEADGVPAERVHLELFRGATAPSPVGDHPESRVSLTLSGAMHTVELAAGESILESALKNGIDAPYACLGGACGTCRAKVTAGTVSMEQNFALNNAELDAGFVLTCQSHPSTATVAVDYDS